jgi:glycosyltransferase involved in cell wall biosynthesis
MKIAFVLSTIGNYGPFIIARDIIKNIISNNAGIEIDVYYLKKSDKKLEFYANCYKIEFNTRIDFGKYDIVHSHGFIADAFVFYKKKHVGGKWITTLHQKIKPDYSLSYNKFTGFLLEKLWCSFVKKSDCIVTLTNEMAEYYRKIIPHQNITYVYNGITPPLKQPLSVDEHLKFTKIKATNKILGVSANLIYRKGIDQIIKSLSINDNKNIVLMILGDGELKQDLLKQAKELNVENRCLFLGYKANVIDYYAYFDVYIMSSRSEGFGLCVLEAASQRIPVVCSNLSVYYELFDDTEVVRFVLDDILSLNESINFALNNAEDLSDRIHLKYIGDYTALKMAENYFLTYCDLLLTNLD